MPALAQERVWSMKFPGSAEISKERFVERGMMHRLWINTTEVERD